MIYHLLDEPFSAYTGLALSSTVANLMRFDGSSVVVCPEADATWGFGIERILSLPELCMITTEIRGSKMRGWRYVPSSVRRKFIGRLFGSLMSRIKSGDVVWCHNWPYVASALERDIHSKGAKLIYHSHNSLAPYVSRDLFKSFTPDALIFNSEAMRREALSIMQYLKYTHAIHNGADETLFYPMPAGAVLNRTVPIVLFVGRLVPIKGVHILIEAMKILYDEQIPVVCKVIGSSHAGGRRSKVTTYIKSLHKSRPPNVQLEGFRAGTDIAQEYRGADVLCCPSIWQEPFGYVNIEAMACGIPVVASRVGGIPEIAAEGGVVLVEPNSALDLAGALRRMVQDKELRAKTGAEGLASFRRRFTWAKIVTQHRELIANL